MLTECPTLGVMSPSQRSRESKRPGRQRQPAKPPGEQLRAWRKHRGMSQEALAARAGYTQGMISQWENAESTMDLDHVVELAAALDITERQFLQQTPTAEETIEDVYEDLSRDEQRRLMEIAKTLRRIPTS